MVYKLGNIIYMVCTLKENSVKIEYLFYYIFYKTSLVPHIWNAQYLIDIHICKKCFIGYILNINILLKNLPICMVLKIYGLAAPHL